MPSDLIPIQNDMIISFVNYEVRVKLDNKSDDELREQQNANSTFFSDQAAGVRRIVEQSGVPATPVVVAAPVQDNSEAEAARVAQE